MDGTSIPARGSSEPCGQQAAHPHQARSSISGSSAASPHRPHADPPGPLADVVARFGRVDVLVNNAGRGHVGAVEETTDEELRSLMELHFFGPAALTRAVLPHMRARKSGAIVHRGGLGAGRRRRVARIGGARAWGA